MLQVTRAANRSSVAAKLKQQLQNLLQNKKTSKYEFEKAITVLFLSILPSICPRLTTHFPKRCKFDLNSWQKPYVWEAPWKHTIPVFFSPWDSWTFSASHRISCNSSFNHRRLGQVHSAFKLFTGNSSQRLGTAYGGFLKWGVPLNHPFEWDFPCSSIFQYI